MVKHLESLKRERGNALIEAALTIALIALMAIPATAAFASRTEGVFEYISGRDVLGSDGGSGGIGEDPGGGGGRGGSPGL